MRARAWGGKAFNGRTDRANQPGDPAKPPRFAPASLFPPRGLGVCRVCLKPAKYPRRYWCSEACVGLYLALKSGHGLRRLVFDRDLGVCSMPDCRLDCTALETELNKWNRSGVPALRALFREFRAELAVKADRTSYWDADHVQAVADGGGCTGLLNVRTLCLWCHKRRGSEQADAKANRPSPVRPSGAQQVRPLLATYRVRAESIKGSR